MKYQGTRRSLFGTLWHVVVDEKHTYWVTLDPKLHDKARDGYRIAAITSEGGDVYDPELRKQIILTAWPMILEDT